MKNRKIILRAFVACASLTLFSISSFAQLVSGGAFMKGNYVEIGIDSAGGFEGTSATVLPGMHFRSNNPLFGFVANPQMDGWVNFDGDFFTPGSPENGWGFEIGTTGSSAMGDRLGNNCSYLQEIDGMITSWSYTGGQILCDWEGDATVAGLHFKISYDLQDTNLFYITTISVTNNTSSTINDLYYHRNLDPDNNISLTSDYTTQNTIISQITAGGPHTSVKATQATPWASLFEFIAVDPGWVAGYGGFANRDASDMYNGIGYTQTVGATNFADEAIYLAYKIPSLPPAGTNTFKFASVFDPASVTAAIAAMSTIATSTEDAANEELVSIYPNPVTENTVVKIDPSVSLDNASFIVYDVVGREVAAMMITSHEFKFSKNLPNGMYFYKIINNKKEIASGKMLRK